MGTSVALLLLTASLCGAADEVDPVAARRACEQGHGADCTALGHYRRGRPGGNVHQAADLFHKACDLGDGEGCSALAAMYEQDKAFADKKAQADALYRHACDLGARDACFQFVHRYLYGARAPREDAVYAVERERQLCAAESAVSCWDLSDWTAMGIPGVVSANLEKARAYAQRTCDLGFTCDTLQALSHPEPSANEQDDIRETVLRAHIRMAAQPSTDPSPFVCIAFGTDADPPGADPPAAFLQRFADNAHVKPRSWCVANRQGSRFSVGPVDGRPRPYPKQRTARLWLLAMGFRGEAWGQALGVQEADGHWMIDATAGVSDVKPPVVPKPDQAEDRRRIAVLAGTFADAWNRRDFEAMERLQGTARAGSSGWRDRLSAGMADTRLDPDVLAVDFGDGRSWVSTSLSLHGTWQRRPGAIAPLEPWRHEGARTTIRIFVEKTTSYWQPGDWELRMVTLPWERIRAR